MDPLGHYLRIHLTGAAGGIELFGRGAHHDDPEARKVLLRIRDEVVQERAQLLRIADAAGVRPAPLAAVGAKVGEHISRLKPNGHPLHRTPLTDLVDLETMRVALSGKISGWEALCAVADEHPTLPAAELQDLLDQGLRQREQVGDLHLEAARRALAG